MRVVFSSSKTGKSIQYSTEDPTRSLVIEATGTKYLSLMKDEFVIDIYNLNYREIVQLINHGYDKVEIFAGYETSYITRIFKGKIFYISMDRSTRETSIAHIICVSEIASMFHSRLNLSLNSGINMYSAINYLLKSSGVSGANISPELQRIILNDEQVYKGSPISIVDSMLGDNLKFIGQSDSSENATLSIWDLKRSDRRKIIIDPSKGMIINGPPTLTTDGVRFESLPVLNYMPGDILLIDNRYINMAISSLREAQSSNFGVMLSLPDEETNLGKYILYEVKYDLSNADGDFKLTLLAKSARLLDNVLGGG